MHSVVELESIALRQRRVDSLERTREEFLATLALPGVADAVPDHAAFRRLIESAYVPEVLHSDPDQVMPLGYPTARRPLDQSPSGLAVLPLLPGEKISTHANLRKFGLEQKLKLEADLAEVVPDRDDRRLALSAMEPTPHWPYILGDRMGSVEAVTFAFSDSGNDSLFEKYPGLRRYWATGNSVVRLALDDEGKGAQPQHVAHELRHVLINDKSRFTDTPPNDLVPAEEFASYLDQLAFAELAPNVAQGELDGLRLIKEIHDHLATTGARVLSPHSRAIVYLEGLSEHFKLWPDANVRLGIDSRRLLGRVAPALASSALRRLIDRQPIEAPTPTVASPVLSNYPARPQ